jgi:beta-glucosidase
VEIFTRYGEKIIDEFGDHIDIAVILNEPAMPLVFGFLLGKYPPGKVNPLAYLRASKNLAKIYKNIYDYAKEKNKTMPVGITTLYNFFEPKNKRNPIDKFISWCGKKFWNEFFVDKIRGEMDYFGLDYYFHDRMSILGIKNEDKKVTDVNWEIYPEGIYQVLKEIKNKYKLPIYIMENGLADKDDKYRVKFIEDHLKYVNRAITEGAEIKGYFHWSLMDNFEWLYGFEPRFGLVEIDYKTLERKPRESFYVYKEIIKNNGI